MKAPQGYVGTYSLMGVKFQILNFHRYSFLRSICLRTLWSLFFFHSHFIIACFPLYKIKAYFLSQICGSCFSLWKSLRCKTKGTIWECIAPKGGHNKKLYKKYWGRCFISLAYKLVMKLYQSSIIFLKTLKQNGWHWAM